MPTAFTAGGCRWPTATAYVTRVTHLVILAPDTVQSIVRGVHPPALNAERLIRQLRLPMDWSEQRTLLGFDR